MIPTGEQPLFHIYLPEALSLAQSNGLGEGWFLTFISYMAQNGAILAGRVIQEQADATVACNVCLSIQTPPCQLCYADVNLC